MLVDVHAHMDFEEYMDIKIDIDKNIASCESEGVVSIVSQGVDIASNRKVLELSSKYEIVKAALGIYPTHCYEMIIAGKQKDFDFEIDFIDKQLKNKKAIAIGEVGLEYKEVEPTEENKKIMKDCLRKFIGLAKKYDVPIILHSRGA
jgi:TatD DNase family protein